MTGASSISTRKNMRPAAQANDERWGGCRGTYEGETFEEGVERLKEFMRLRLEWMDEQFASVEMLRLSLGGYVVSDQIWVEQIDTGAQEGRTRVEIRSDAQEGRSVSLQVNGLWFYEAGLSDGKAEFWIEDQALRADGGRQYGAGPSSERRRRLSAKSKGNRGRRVCECGVRLRLFYKRILIFP